MALTKLLQDEEEKKQICDGGTSKGSLKTRIKSLIVEELSKKRIHRHHRSTTDFSQPELICSTETHHLESPSEIVPYELQNREELLNTKEALLKENTLVYRSRELIDTLNLIDMSQKLFLKMLGTPTSGTTEKTKLTKSKTFPIAGGGFESKLVLDGSHLEEEWNATKSPPADIISKPVENTRPEAIKRFKNLKQKIKHVIKENTKDRERISMDAVLHKIPYGKSFLKEENCLHDSQTSSFRKSEKPHQIRRTSSFKDSLHRYSQLFESSFRREPGYSMPGIQTLRNENGIKNLARLNSLPDLRSHFFQTFEGPYKTITPEEYHQVDESMLKFEYDNNKLDCSNDDSSTPEEDEYLEFNVDSRDEGEFNYMRDVLELSGLSRKEILGGTCHYIEQPMDPSVFENIESSYENNEEMGRHLKHMLMFDLINEVLIEKQQKSTSYCPVPLSCLSHIRLVSGGDLVFKEVWRSVGWYLSFRPKMEMELEQSLENVVSQDLSKDDGWMNLQFDAECVGLQIEDLLFHNLLEEIIFTLHYSHSN